MIRKFLTWLVAVLTAYVLAAASATQSVLESLAGLGVQVTTTLRFQTTLHDLAGMSTSLLPLVAIGFAIGLPAAAGIARWCPAWRTQLLVLGGAVAIVAIHVLLKISFEITPFAIARTPAGLLVQGLAGAIGGGVFAVLSRRWQTNS